MFNVATFCHGKKYNITYEAQQWSEDKLNPYDQVDISRFKIEVYGSRNLCVL